MTVVSGRWFEDFLRDFFLRAPCHDEPAPGAWACGVCPYMNTGAICSKCGAPRWLARLELTRPTIPTHEYALAPALGE